MPPRPQAPSIKHRRRLFALLWMSPALLPLVWWLLKPAGVSVRVETKTWQLAIEIETLVEDHGSSWCDEVPSGVRVTLRRTMIDPSGVRTAPAEHCRYTGPQWRALHSAMAEGRAPAPPLWPKLSLAPVPDPPPLGAERPGKRHERYEIRLRAASGQTWTCRLPLAQWQGVTPDLSFLLQVDRHGVAHCGSVPGQRSTAH
ncbi:hypothetical protein [Roseateles toxinivorans]|nr:hypothetical protein [Roseateles toxinivorans]